MVGFYRYLDARVSLLEELFKLYQRPFKNPSFSFSCPTHLVSPISVSGEEENWKWKLSLCHHHHHHRHHHHHHHHHNDQVWPGTKSWSSRAWSAADRMIWWTHGGHGHGAHISMAHHHRHHVAWKCMHAYCISIVWVCSELNHTVQLVLVDPCDRNHIDWQTHWVCNRPPTTLNTRNLQNLQAFKFSLMAYDGASAFWNHNSNTCINSWKERKSTVLNWHCTTHDIWHCTTYDKRLNKKKKKAWLCSSRSSSVAPDS